eukprot:CAMPEP_0177240330 /NCGR_PEP_ID=MMETSP0367-20130122/47649_1 /TAXON_ID=447022 ORGANISM="Scrippsiella hangoei-like, Strain SHHI-4" /NCGR_SAMPLE_ID=MMETSP0367 /ASSEMBLY_ACC=CAM_ASM_000362 /LENGTH=49 /DNA_ID= /DNA_START= /DNA_END= /DNA_ORIENTATION=
MSGAASWKTGDEHGLDHDLNLQKAAAAAGGGRRCLPPSAASRAPHAAAL